MDTTGVLHTGVFKTKIPGQWLASSMVADALASMFANINRERLADVLVQHAMCRCGECAPQY
jgi:hypothetical protein